MAERYCSECSGTVNLGSPCPKKMKPDACPLALTEGEHYAALAEQEIPGPVSQTVEGLTEENAQLHARIAELEAGSSKASTKKKATA